MSDHLGEAIRQAGYSQDGYKRAAARAEKAEKENADLRAQLEQERQATTLLVDALEQIRDDMFRYNMGHYEICAKNAARLALNATQAPKES